MRKRISALSTATLSILFVTACSAIPSGNRMDIKAGDTFILNKPVTFAPDHARVFIQYGKQTRQSTYEKYDQHCRLEIKTLKSDPQTLQPDTFKITQVRIDVEEIASQTPSPNDTIHYAMNDTDYFPKSKFVQTESSWVRLSLGGDSEPPETMDIVHLYLSSKTQPDILRLTCAGALSTGDPLDAPRSYRPQQKQINTILGAYGKITTSP
ncbi:hypothetical protein P8629_00985 [Hydrogenovibrio sp. 3SP14C1]|uniref:hypothetical protein n=1 Tax=Hydrogenovibrio sp. 3SP14C1 TaxID=3038774 RepID=UPI002415DBC5|nr:hypothetical protein [Hydrogenovibrio sp. 3SP14C1]MDG4811568.1 hypothetical protein [Hydrogenovibrio sp. 3SP14C1]